MIKLLINNMKTVHIYKLSTHKYFFTTVLDNTSDTTKKYEYVCDVDVEDDEQQISMVIQTILFHDNNIEKNDENIDDKTDENVDKIQTTIIQSDKFDDCWKKFYLQMKTDLPKYSDIFYTENTHDVFSNVYNLKIAAHDYDLNFAWINAQQISTIDIKQYLSQQKPQITTVYELNCAIDAFTGNELDIFTVQLPISSNPYQTMRNRGSCMTTINEYYIPTFGISYNFEGTTNILIGDIFNDRYVERYGENEKSIKFRKTQISGEDLTNTLSALKSYTNFKLSIGKLFVPEQMDEDTC